MIYSVSGMYKTWVSHHPNYKVFFMVVPNMRGCSAWDFVHWFKVINITI